jgi:hypothetical protein
MEKKLTLTNTTLGQTKKPIANAALFHKEKLTNPADSFLKNHTLSTFLDKGTYSKGAKKNLERGNASCRA